MFRHVKLGIATLVRPSRSRQSLLLENLALRQQLAALKRRHPRPSLGNFDRLFWVVARRLWSGWRQSLILVTQETVVLIEGNNGKGRANQDDEVGTLRGRARENLSGGRKLK